VLPPLESFLRALRRATADVPADYFALPVADAQLPISPERVYCYELYHQLRVATNEEFLYTLSGEIDKAGYPLLPRGEPARKPDLVVHRPGTHENLLVIEVKPSIARVEEFEAALTSLVWFTSAPLLYERALLLVFGGERGALVRTLRRLTRYEQELRDEVVLVFHHAEAGAAAEKVSGREIAAA
jgi:hypothetical protein